MSAAASRPWIQALKLYLSPRPITLLFLGFSSGLPLLLVFSSLSFWLREAGIERSSIGFISWGRPGLCLQMGLGSTGG